MAQEISYKINYDTGSLFAYSTRWDPMLIAIGGEKKVYESGIRGVLFNKDKAEHAEKLIAKINAGKVEYKSKIGKVLVDGGDKGLFLVEYGKGLAIYEFDLHERLKGINAIYNNGIETIRSDRKGGWVLSKDKLDSAMELVKEYNSNILGTIDIPTKRESTHVPVVREAKDKDIPKGYQRVDYILEKPYLNQRVTVNIGGKSNDTKVISIVPRFNDPMDVVDLIQLGDGNIASIVSGRWELLYEPRNHSLKFH